MIVKVVLTKTSLGGEGLPIYLIPIFHNAYVRPGGGVDSMCIVLCVQLKGGMTYHPKL